LLVRGLRGEATSWYVLGVRTGTSHLRFDGCVAGL